MAAEGEFPKVDGDIFYASEVNPFGTSGIVSFTGSKTLIQFGKQNIALSTTDQIIFNPPFSAIPIVTKADHHTNVSSSLTDISTGSFGIINPNAGFSIDVDWIAIGTE